MCPHTGLQNLSNSEIQSLTLVSYNINYQSKRICILEDHLLEVCFMEVFHAILVNIFN